MKVSLIEHAGSDGHCFLLKMHCDLEIVLLIGRIDFCGGVYPDRQINLRSIRSKDFLIEHYAAVREPQGLSHGIHTGNGLLSLG
ncbi:hypothetical protein LT17_06335 [Pseudomonas aeruginosa]|uniref:hypothetical protein n=1 Tax=Pseudomonas aeruginosa TaxID=287 RepID=UPI0002CBD346|nr:hypothetical protein [Pseudomonas aeruginosa]EMZ44335.1 hypothetical protein HMPREF1223_13548 [Pseudomonas aeruginosa str. Stone 130]KXG12356.1 hypothetical protein LT17_06335 [Pseudomonas aeruginosa]WGT18919.1 hypothetical protein P4N66_gene5025 [Pseudomonas aeruginosa]